MRPFGMFSGYAPAMVPGAHRDYETATGFMKLVIPMAGRGMRVRPHSHVTPKPLLPVRGRSMVERIVDTFQRVLPVPLEEGVFVLGPDFGENAYEMLREICARRAMRPRFAVQQTAQGTAHAVAAARDYLEGPGVVAFADTVFDMDAGLDFQGADVVAMVKHVEDPSRFGVAVRKGGRVTKLVEKPSDPISTEALVGIYYVRDLAELRGVVEGIIGDDLRGKGGEFYLTDAFDRMIRRGDAFTTAPVSEWLDCGTIPALMETTRRLLEKEDTGVYSGDVENSIVIPPVYIGPGARVEDSVVGPYVSVEAGADIRRCILERSIVFPGAMACGAVLTDSLIGRHARVRPGAQTLNIGDHAETGRAAADAS